MFRNLFVTLAVLYSLRLFVIPGTNALANASSSLNTKQALKPLGKVRLYKGTEGATATIIDLAEPKDKALIKIEGTNSYLDNVVLLHERKEHDGGRRFSYDTIVKGEGFSTVYSESSYWGEQIFLQNPEYVTKKISLYYDAKASEKLKSASLIEQHLSQVKDGKVGSIQKK